MDGTHVLIEQRVCDADRIVEQFFVSHLLQLLVGDVTDDTDQDFELRIVGDRLFNVAVVVFQVFKLIVDLFAGKSVKEVGRIQ